MGNTLSAWRKTPAGSYDRAQRHTPSPYEATTLGPAPSGVGRINACTNRNPPQSFYEETAARTTNSIYRDTADCYSCGHSAMMFKNPVTEQANAVPNIFTAQVSMSDGFHVDRDQYYTKADVCDVTIANQCNCPYDQVLSPVFPSVPAYKK